MNEATLHTEIAKVCPIISVTVNDGNDRSTWSFVPEAVATSPEIAAGNEVIATIPLGLGQPVLLATGDMIAKWTNAEYLALQKLRTTDNGKMAKDWDVTTSDPFFDPQKKRTQTLKSNLVSAGILTQARADEIFS